jgi:two-component system, chemotaxis family, chemotaxis protein CheY
MKEVLVVDDSAVIRKVARRLLEDLHIRVFEATDGPAGLAACEQRMPHAIIVDAHMPQMDVFEFLNELRRMPEGATPKVLFCSVENDVGPMAKALHAGADDFLLKPFNQSILRGKIEDIGLV